MTKDNERTSLEIALGIGEASLDQILDEGLLRDVPVLGTVCGMARLAKSIPDRIFLAKLSRFVKAIEMISPEERIAFRRKLERDPKTLRRVGETLVLVLNKLDDMDKPELLGKAFRAYVRGVITYEQFRRLSAAIDASLVSDLQQFGTEVTSVDQSLLEHLASTGLARPSTAGLTETGGLVFSSIKITEIGELFQKLYRDQL
jgi:hypothetical protein